MNKTLVKEKIREYENYINGFNMLSGAGVKVVNLRQKKYETVADIILYNGETEERYNNCVYPNCWLKN